MKHPNAYAKGDPRRTSPRLRFLSKITITETCCWQWAGGISTNGYGRVGVGRRVDQAHRVAYELFRGPIPPGMELDHLCRNRGCVNPDHLEPVSKQENIRRGEGGQHWAQKTHCPKGHAYTADNIKWQKAGKNRACLECHRISGREYMRRVRAVAAGRAA